MSDIPKTMKALVYIYAKYDYTYDGVTPGKMWQLDFWSLKIDNEKNLIFLATREIEVDTSNFNPVPEQLAALEEEKRQATAAFVTRTAEINEQISNLLAIENRVETSAPAPQSDNIQF